MKNDKTLKCLVPSCQKPIPAWRIRDGRITCCKSCAMSWNHLSNVRREKIRGKKYNKVKK